MQAVIRLQKKVESLEQQNQSLQQTVSLLQNNTEKIQRKIVEDFESFLNEKNQRENQLVKVQL